VAGSDRDTGDGRTTPAAGAPRFRDAPTMANPSADSKPITRLTETLPDPNAPVRTHLEARRPQPDASPMRGDRLGENDRFEIVERLGAGGMGHVFRAVDWHLDRIVAIKLILQHGEMPLDQLVAMLRSEAQATAKLNHENIVAIFDMDAYRGMPFLVMELLDGQSLDVMLRRSRMSPLRATQIMTQVARGLSHAHANGVVHRDLKPSNVFILRNGRAKILDFGISRFRLPVVTSTQGSDAAPTSTGFGTPAFMSPERWRGQAQDDARSDIWAAGVMLYQMLTGRLPYTLAELLKFQTKARVRSLAPSVRLLMPALPEEADRLVATALNEDPQGRFQTAREMMEALGELERVIAGHSSDPQVARSAPQIERRPLTILACHLEVLDSLDIDDIVDIDQRFYQAAVDSVKRAQGCIGTPVGGKFFCCFGYPAVKENDAQRAVWAALQIAQVMREYGRQDGAGLDFKIGVHSGVVGLPDPPGAGQGLPTMQGNVPNIAVRLAEAAPPGSVVMSQATLELTTGLFHTQAQTSKTNGTPDKGRSAVYQVLGEVESSSRFEQSFSAQLTPFVGREKEFAFLHQLWEDAKEGRGQILAVSGEPGIGKSRLVQILKDRVIGEGNVRLTCQCWPHFKNSALHPLIDLVLRSMDIRREDTPEEKFQKLENNLTSLEFALPETVPLFGALLSIAFEPKHAPLGLPPEQQKVKMLEALVSMLLRTALNRPALFIIEDMQWVDHSTIECLNVLIDVLPSSRILVVLTGRPEFRPPWSARRHLHELTLSRLSSASTLSLIGQASKGKSLPPEMIERIAGTTDGVPLFVEELTRMVVESWRPTETGQIANLAIPGTLRDLLLARLNQLRGVGKEVAQVGSILGRDFDYELIRHVSPFDEMSLQEGLEILADAGILHSQGRPPESKYVFKHALIQQAAYQSLVKSERHRHHQCAAQVLSEVFKETAELQPELLAHHYSEAGNPCEALAFWEKAGQRATQRSALVEAIDHYTRARDALKTRPEGLERDKKELALLLALGSPLMSVHGYANAEVEKTYARARELARVAGGQADIFPAMQGLWQFYYVRGMLPASRELGNQLLEIARESANSTWLLLAHRSIASSAFLQGDYETCRVHTQAGIGIYDMREHGSLAMSTGHDPGVAHGVYLAWALWMLGYPDQSLARVTDTIELAKRLAHPMTIAYALCFAALMRNHRGDHVEAKALSETALDITVPNKFALWTAWAKMQRGWAMAGMEDYEQGIPLMKEGLEGWKSTGARVGFTFFPVTLAEMCLHTGQYSETARLLEEAAPMVANNDEHFCEPELLRLKGELCLAVASERDGAAADASAHFARGIEVARALSGKSWELRLATSRARLLASRGEIAEAADTLREMHGWFTEGFETADLRAARGQIEAFQAGAST
jgi:TOMM system kinase/cyclase fusion protein